MRKPLAFLDKMIASQLSMNIWSDVYGLARSLLALSTLLTLLCNNSYTLFKPFAGGTDECISCLGIARYSIFCLFPIPVSKGISIVILFFVLIGYLPRVFAFFHVWVTTSLMLTALLVDGGDQVVTVLSVLLLPIALTDTRKWHWSNYVKENTNKFSSLIASSTWLIIRLQVALIYFESCVGKFKTTEWANGTALYYWFSNAQFGLPKPVLNIFIPVLASSFGVVILTWLVLIFEALLFLGINMNKKYRGYLLVAGICFHFSIFLVHGLPTFFLSMTAALILFLRPPDQFFNFENKLPFLSQNNKSKIAF